MKKELYKYTFEYRYSFDDVEEGEIIFVPVLITYPVLRETKFSYIIKYYGHKNNEKVVPKKGKNIFARPIKEEAFSDFIARKKKQKRILKLNLKRLSEMLDIIEKTNRKI